jgi:GNAT superfamily N-acetyltransferase
VQLADRPAPAWCRLLAAGQGAADVQAEHRLLETVGAPSAYATALLDGRPAAVGRAVLDDGWAGVLGMATLPDARRRGAATAVLAALAGWAADRDGVHLYLQVSAASSSAAALYRRAGFAPVCAYHYRCAQD